MQKKSHKLRKSLMIILCLFVCGFVIYSLGSIFYEVSLKNKENEELALELLKVKEEHELLKVEENKLKDPEYLARKAREKYLYSGEDEYIFRIK